MKIVQLPPITADGVRRLLILATFLEGLEISDESFDLDDWGVRSHECGTVGCAVGWGTLCPELKAEGLTQHGTNLSPRYSPDGENSTVGGWEAVGMFFGMGNADGQFEDVQTGGSSRVLLKEVSERVHSVLFDSYFYPRGVKRQDVVARIREVALLASKNLDGATP